jgi:hypothetical protein
MRLARSMLSGARYAALGEALIGRLRASGVLRPDGSVIEGLYAAGNARDPAQVLRR